MYWGSWGGFWAQHPSVTEREVLLMREGIDTELAMVEMVKGRQGVRDGCQIERRFNT